MPGLNDDVVNINTRIQRLLFIYVHQGCGVELGVAESHFLGGVGVGKDVGVGVGVGKNVPIPTSK